MSLAASLPGAEVSSEIGSFLNMPLVPGSFAAWGRTFSQNYDFILDKPLVWGSFAAWGRTVSRMLTLFGQSHLSGAASLLGAELFPENHFLIRIHLSRAASLPGAELLAENDFFFEEATSPGQLRCLGQNFFSKLRLF